MSNYIGLYYPFISFKDDAWVKLAALYWDKLGRIIPSGYEPRDSDTVLQLTKELGFIENFAPSSEDTFAVSEMFFTMLNQHRGKLTNLYSVDSKSKFSNAPVTVVLDYRAPVPWSNALQIVSRTPFKEELDPKLAYIISEGKMWDTLEEELVRAGLASRQYLDRDTTLVGMHPMLAYIYMEVLAERMASTRQLHPLTDNMLDHLVVGGYTVERLTQALLVSDDTTSNSTRNRFRQGIKRLQNIRRQPHLSNFSTTTQEIETQIATIALRSVLPKDIASVPTKKIVKLRAKHRDEMTAFQMYIHGFVTDLEKLQDINDSVALKAHLEAEYEKKLKPQLDDLKKILSSLAVDTVTGALNIRVAIPSLLASAGTYFTQIHLPPVSPIVVGAGAVAFSVYPVIQKKQEDARQVVRSSPTAYLLYAQEGLEPTNLARQVAQRTRQIFFHV